MNEVALIEQRRQEFTAQHPLGDGWKLYEIATGVAWTWACATCWTMCVIQA